MDKLKETLPRLDISSVKATASKKKNTFLLSPGALQRTQSKIGMSLLFNNSGQQPTHERQVEQNLQLLSMCHICVDQKSGCQMKVQKRKKKRLNPEEEKQIDEMVFSESEGESPEESLEEAAQHTTGETALVLQPGQSNDANSYFNSPSVDQMTKKHKFSSEEPLQRLEDSTLPLKNRSKIEGETHSAAYDLA